MDFECKNNTDRIMVILRGFGLIALYVVITTVLNIGLSLIHIKNNPTFENIKLIVIDIIITLVLLLLFHRIIKRDFKDFKNNYKDYLRKSIPYWIVGLVIMIASNIIINIIINDGSMAANEATNRQALSAYPIASIISMCLFAPICEELLFRASFKNAFNNIVAFCLFTGIFFALMHVISGKNLTEALYLIPYSSVGIAFGYAYFKTNNIFSSISLHIMHNTFTVILIILSTIGTA